MIHLVLLLFCILSIEIFIRLKFLSLLDSLLKVTKKAYYIILQNNISDHWKEKIVPAYAVKVMKYSLQILIILLIILSLFIFTELFINDFLAFTLSLNGIIESMVFLFGYSILRKLFFK